MTLSFFTLMHKRHFREIRYDLLEKWLLSLLYSKTVLNALIKYRFSVQ